MVARGVLLVMLVFLVACVGGGAGVDGPIMPSPSPSPSPPQRLSRSDVTGMPTGSAMGNVFSGSYLVEQAHIDACVCRAGTCAPFQALSGATATITQLDGAFVSSGNGICTGGIDHDGQYWCGDVEESAAQTVYGLERGTFLLSSGKPVSKLFTIGTTMAITIRGIAHDCDLQATGTARYIGP